ncbi:YesL family protein [Alkalicoccobacillus murimartini]|uniref:Membrane protein YesL n=1 Tax=Alkalicoccobacillus murimartini TaxID=171685 RepID=A0ABT9YIY5_9BACI|nr:DUF624 domain-containing protein [Alkalicoccobacillus murimartini]MDQ0207818.1 putative membrane protein YesL [Alkalicoccobacillus murimartini]
MDGVRGTLLQSFDHISKLAYLNVLWIFFTLIGLGIVGFFPATVALYSIVRKWIQEPDQEMSLFSMFWNEYKNSFFPANKFGFLLLIIGFVLIIDLMIFSNLGTTIGYIISALLTTLLFVYTFMILFCLPVFVHFKGNTLGILKKALTLAIPLLPFSLLFLVLSTLLGVGLIFIPAAGIFFSGSLFAYANLKLFNTAIKRLESRKMHINTLTLQAKS